ncbi:MAG TPA: hypothetical protein VGI81_11720 [Tepidisphaeraceae bacterium]|jgi:hypothetical protein
MDWMTLAIEVTGAVILCVWIVIPIREYRSIYQRLRHRADASLDDRAGAGRSAGTPVTSGDNHDQETHA